MTVVSTSRLLVVAEANEISAAVILNKIDLPAADPDRYAAAVERITNELAQGDLFLGHNH